MIGDLFLLSDRREEASATPTYHLPGDARNLLGSRIGRRPAFPAAWADLSCFSPPYLNCLDYTELYKLELWLMEYITTQEDFRETRRGTLRSHPSVRFEPRSYFVGESGKDIDLVTDISEWIREHGSRKEVGPVVREYFEDMLQVWHEQYRLLKPGGAAVCIVANSTFSLRVRTGSGEPAEHWRLPVLTDVLLGHLALRAGFTRVEIWPARELRPRNARMGRARESLVVVWKPDRS
jgi:hypothetical protein